MNVPPWALAFFWGIVSGSSLLLGAAGGFFLNLNQRLIAAIMAFGGGVLISALTLELMEEAYANGGFVASSLGFIGGAVIYTLANILLARHGAKHRKRSGNQQPDSSSNSGMAIALGSLLDGIPESIVIGLSLIEHSNVKFATVLAIFLSNVPEGLSSSSGMKKANRSAFYVFTLWGSICLFSGLASIAGFTLFRHFSPLIVSATTASAAGAILAMISDTMLPEAFEVTHNYTGLITVVGFLLSFVLSKNY